MRYSYGFNGKEKDDEIKGNGNRYDYGMRIYDPRIEKFLNVDPLSKSYAGISTYGFAEEDPINFIDLDGLERAYKVPGSDIIIPASDYNRHLPPSNAIYLNRSIIKHNPDFVEILDKGRPIIY